jgi:hypothetical protein
MRDGLVKEAIRAGLAAAVKARPLLGDCLDLQVGS